MLSTAIVLVLAFAGTAHTACNRTTLETITANYISAQNLGQLSALPALTSATTYLDDDKPIQISTSILTTPLTIDSYRSILDSFTCTTFTELIVASSPKQYVIGTRMEIDPMANIVTRMETLSTEEGDWAFNATGYAYWNSREKWRYVVDEVMGTVVMWLLFPGLDRGSGRPSPDSHMFRVEGGTIRYIHTLSTCENYGCGMNWTLPQGPPGPMRSKEYGAVGIVR
ncbi:hypothetical protein GQ43DRAFT_447846 [Delitschia confertaspora ATCC 74209]|uniref:DUF8021 domain-containing protein n=1 Tax=Delitschia confertaspora ATCC 74209 TaxID=1513339 RepID=A0A9P4JTA0_9PLEO|nr:hypothetical protein GQ43DRAFT_447846 [Delitschia confertaspora ATCC 74209]